MSTTVTCRAVAERSRVIDLPDGRALAVTEAGDPAGAPVVFHHGTPSAGLLYARWARDAREHGVRLIGFDRAGYGGSDRRAGRTVADVAADVDALAQALGCERYGTWGVSGGGPHALACAALSERCAAAATFAGVGPYGAPDLDFMAGMGEDNVEEFGAALRGEDALRPLLEAFAAAVRSTTAEQLAEQMQTLLSPVDVAALTGAYAEYLLESFQAGLRPGVDGWLDDDLAFTRPWGFDVAGIAVPVQLWQGDQDLMVPHAHGDWLAARIPGVQARMTPGEGHLTVVDDHVGEVHAWLASRL
jgi:pimeloyl-ACP methyl ester carboxylesterase